MGAPLCTPAPKPFQESAVAGAGLPPEWTHLLPGGSRVCSLACSLAVMPASRNARTFSLFSGLQSGPRSTHPQWLLHLEQPVWIRNSGEPKALKSQLIEL